MSSSTNPAPIHDINAKGATEVWSAVEPVKFSATDTIVKRINADTIAIIMSKKPAFESRITTGNGS